MNIYFIVNITEVRVIDICHSQFLPHRSILAEDATGTRSLLAKEVTEIVTVLGRVPLGISIA